MHFDFTEGSFDLSHKDCLLFGILNVTPDSFSDGGRYVSVRKAVKHALDLEKEGADALDIGGESSRPGAGPVSAKEEMRRVISVIRALKGKLKIPISIDTTKAAVAEEAIKHGAAIINDISGLKEDPGMAKVVADSGAGVVLMHKRGTPRTMKKFTKYKDLIKEVNSELHECFRAALAAGISKNKIALDPGIGFAKTREQNLELLRNLKSFASLKRPIMIGVSRKSFLGGDVQDRLPGSLAAEMWSWLHGARMIRTHDVAATRRALRILKEIMAPEF